VGEDRVAAGDGQIEVADIDGNIVGARNAKLDPAERLARKGGKVARITE